MKESIRAEILQPGVEVAEGYGRRKFTPSSLNARGLEFRPTEVGETLDFTAPKVFLKEDSTITLGRTRSGNGVVAQGAYVPIREIFTPLIQQQEVSWKTEFGEQPGGLSTESFGYPNPNIIAEFLGHPDRDILEPVMSIQEKNPRYEWNIQTREAEPQKPGIHLIIAGQVLHTNLYGLEEDTVRDSRRSDYSPDDGFLGEGMLGALFVARKGDPMVELFAATVADEDNLMRVRPAPYTIHLAEGDLDTGLQMLAEYSVFTHHINKLQVPDKRSKIRKVFDSKNAGKKILDDGLPLELPATIEDYISATLKYPGRDFTMRYGIDWDDVKAQLPKEEIESEKARIVDLYHKLA